MAEDETPGVLESPSTSLATVVEWTLPERDEANVRKLAFDVGGSTLTLSFEDDTALSLPISEVERVEYIVDEERKRLVLVRKDGCRAVLNRFGMSRDDAERLIDEINSGLEGLRGDTRLSPLLDVRDALEGSEVLKVQDHDASGYRKSADPRRLRIDWTGEHGADEVVVRQNPANLGATGSDVGNLALMVFYVVCLALFGVAPAIIAGAYWLAGVLFLAALALCVTLFRRAPKVSAVELSERELVLRWTLWRYTGTRNISIRRIARIELAPYVWLPPFAGSGLGVFRLVDEADAELAQIPIALHPADRLRLFNALSRHLTSSRREPEPSPAQP